MNPAKAWPRALDEWVAWVTRLSSHFGGFWASLRIEQFINISTVKASLDVELMCVVLKLWSKSINYFLLLFSPISITLRNVTILTGLPIQGDDAMCLLDV